MTGLLDAVARVRRGVRPGTPEADCCTFARNVLWLAYRLPRRHLALWSIYRDSDGGVPESRVWGPVKAANLEGIGGPVSIVAHPSTAVGGLPGPGPVRTSLPDARAGALYVCQGWSGLQPDGTARPPHSRGHTWLWLALDDRSGLRIDSSRLRGVRIWDFEWSQVARSYTSGIAVSALQSAR